MTGFSPDQLEAIVAARAKVADGSSWTAKLVSGGMEKAAKKLGEEGVETVIAALSEDDDELTGEAADLLYHLLVVLHMRGITMAQVYAELDRRTGQSGLEEKAGRLKS